MIFRVLISVSEWLLFNAKWAIVLAMSRREQVSFWWDDNDAVRFVLGPHAELDVDSASSLK